MGGLSDPQARLLNEATATPAGSASLSDVQHVVILMQENRSFDHYFGIPYPLPTANNMPTQETAPKRPPVP